MRALKVIVAGIGLLGSAAAFAGGYCLVVQGMPANCRFIDEQSCARAAVEQKGGCVSNNTGQLASAVNVSPDHSRYCLISGGSPKCWFFDAQSCAKAAQESGGSCLTRP